MKGRLPLCLLTQLFIQPAAIFMAKVVLKIREEKISGDKASRKFSKVGKIISYINIIL